MYQVGQKIVYGSAGVCTVEAVEVPANIPTDGQRLYYRLKPLHDAGVIYTPVDTTVFMRPVITEQQARQLLEAIPGMEPSICPSHSPQILGEHYKGFFRSHSCEDLLRLIKTVHIKNKTAAPGRSLSKTDQQYLRRAEDMLYSELSVALQQPREAIKPCIDAQLQSAE
ncbi:MAG: CarD family transcriptional regulator [Faecalibacterium sp.]|nr:CarD family transcriptional regulator [Faecalibacterium sp.]